VTLISDVSDRDKDTSNQLVKGLQLSPSVISYCGSLWDPIKYHVCAEYNNETRFKDTHRQLSIVPRPKIYERGVEVLQKIIGVGKEKPIRQIPNQVEKNGYYTGGITVMGESLETILLEQGSGIQIGWGRMTKEELYQYLSIHIFFDIINNGYETCRNLYSNYLFHFRQHFQEPGTIIYVGHDTDMTCLNALLGMSWQPRLFPENATVPGSGIRFDYDNETQTITTNYFSTDFSNDNGNLNFVPAIFKHTGKNVITFEEYSMLVDKVIDPMCVLKNGC